MHQMSDADEKTLRQRVAPVQTPPKPYTTNEEQMSVCARVVNIGVPITILSYILYCAWGGVFFSPL
jgi:hypothetical protein